MDGISVAASLVGIGAAGCQVAIKLVTLATQISTASDRISSISNDVFLTSGVLQQLGELMTQKVDGDDTSIFSQGGLETTETSAAICETIFKKIENATRDASEQIRGRAKFMGGKIKLSKSEKAKWPFLQPSIEALRTDLREAKGTLMLMLQVTSLAFSKRMAEIHSTASTNIIEQRDIIQAILAFQQQQLNSPDARPKQLSPDCSSEGTPKPGSRRSTPETYTGHNEKSAIGPNPTKSSVIPKPNILITIPSDMHEDNNGKKSPTQHIGKNCVYKTNQDRGLEESEKSNPGQSLRDGYSRRTSESTTNDENGDLRILDLYTMRPIVKDLIDIIQLSWTTCRPPMHQDLIQEHISKNEKDSTLPVFERYESLYSHEHKAVESAISEAKTEAILISLKRTYVDMQYREITFKGVPGLEFILQREPSAPLIDQGWGGSQPSSQSLPLGRNGEPSVSSYACRPPMKNKFYQYFAKEKLSMTDLGDGGQGLDTGNGAAQNDGPRSQPPPPYNWSERVRTPADVMKERRDREIGSKEAEMGRERAYGQYLGSVTSRDRHANSDSTASEQGQQTDFSRSGHGETTGWEAVPRHHHPTRLSDVLEEDDWTNRKSSDKESSSKADHAIEEEEHGDARGLTLNLKRMMKRKNQKGLALNPQAPVFQPSESPFYTKTSDLRQAYQLHAHTSNQSSNANPRKMNFKSDMRQVNESNTLNELPSHADIFKSYAVNKDALCRELLPATLKIYGIQEWQRYNLLITYNVLEGPILMNRERIIELDERPLRVLEEFDRKGQNPMFKLVKKAVVSSMSKRYFGGDYAASFLSSAYSSKLDASAESGSSYQSPEASIGHYVPPQYEIPFHSGSTSSSSFGPPQHPANRPEQNHAQIVKASSFVGGNSDIASNPSIIQGSIGSSEKEIPHWTAQESESDQQPEALSMPDKGDEPGEDDAGEKGGRELCAAFIRRHEAEPSEPTTKGKRKRKQEAEEEAMNDEAKAEKLVNELLGKYTTLFDAPPAVSAKRSRMDLPGGIL